MGTPAYMAPEQWLGEPPTPAVDIYALDVMFHEMLAGEAPFKADTPYAMMNAHIYKQPPPLRTSRPELPPTLDDVLAKALAEAPQERFQSVRSWLGLAAPRLKGIVCNQHADSHQPSFATPKRPDGLQDGATLFCAQRAQQ